MLKKWSYIFAGVLLLFLGYLNYFKEEEPSDIKIENVIETSNVAYEAQGYKIEAATQTDDIDTKETKFKFAKALFDKMTLQGDNVFIDSLKNLLLEGNIFGVSTNGWKFDATEAKYDRNEEKIYSDNGVTVYNEEKKIEISGKRLETDIEISYALLKDDVQLNSGKFVIKAGEARYSQDTQLIDIKGPITVRGKDLSGVLTGEFKKAKYNTESNILEAWEPFVMEYEGIKLYGENFWYDEKTENFVVSQNVHLEKDGSVLYTDNIEHIAKDNILVFNGKIHGGDQIYTVAGDKGYYNTVKKETELVGNVVIKNKDGENMQADRAVYTTEGKVFYAYGEKKDVVFNFPDGKMISKSIKYSTQTGEFSTEKPYTFQNKDYTSKGEKFYYNKFTGEGKVTQGDLKSKDFYGKGDLLEFNTERKRYVATGNGYFENKDYSIVSNRLIYSQNSGKVEIPGDYTAMGINKDELFKGVRATYNANTGEFISYGNFQGENSDYTFTGVNLNYNKNSKEGKIGRDVILVNRKDGTRITGNSGRFKTGDFAEVTGNLKLENSELIAYGDRVTYREKEGKAYIPGNIKMTGKKSQVSGTMRDGIFDLKTSIYTGKDFRGKSKDTTAQGDVINYYIHKDYFELSGNVVMKDPQTEFRGQQGKYFNKTEEIEADKPFKVYYNTLEIDSSKGKFNMGSRVLDGENVVVISDKGEKIQGDHVRGSFAGKTLDFTGNVKALLYKTDEKNGEKERVDFSGGFARIYFVDKDGYRATRSEIKNNGIFKYRGMTLYSDYLEVDFERSQALGKNGTRLVMEDGTQVKSDTADVDLKTEVAVLRNNVEIIKHSEKPGYTKITAERGIIRNKEKKAELEGNVVAENDSAVITADRVIYDMNTDKLKASGNVFIDYKTK